MSAKRKSKPLQTEGFFCTECGVDSYIRYSGWTGPDGKYIIGKKENICPKCAAKRKVKFL